MRKFFYAAVAYALIAVQVLSPASAMLMVNELVGFGDTTATAAPPVLTYIGSPSTNTSNNTTYSITSVPIGTASADRLVVVAVRGLRDAVTSAWVSSATIAGNAASIDVAPTGNRAAVAIISAIVTTGTTATIAVTFSGAMQNCTLSVWTITGLQSTTPVDTNGQALSANAASISTTLDFAAGGVGIIAASKVDNSDTMSLSGATSRDERATESSWMRTVAGDYTASTAETARAMSATWSTNATYRTIAAASYR